MFTPQRKPWSAWSLTPHKKLDGSVSDPNASVERDGAVEKKKGVAFAEPVTPNTRDEDGSNSLAEKLSKLENELFEYQYNMGLLLIEKKEWGSKLEELRLELLEAKDALKREQAAHLIAISDVEKREDNLRKALGVEKQCVLDLDKELRAMRSENAEIKFTADSKLAEVNALIASIEEKSLDVESKLRAADAKLAEVSRKASEIERKSQEVESSEKALRRERLSFISERGAHESDLLKQRDDLRDWENKLREVEERLAKGQIILGRREERANETDKIIKKKENYLEELQKKIDAANLDMREKEADLAHRLSKLATEEKASDALRKKLDLKEKDLLEMEEKLNEREKVEIQKLLDEHNAILAQKQHEFELEIDQKRKSLDAELKSKVIELDKKGAELNHMEEKVSKREQALDKRFEKLKEKEKEFELKMNVFKEREKALRSEEKDIKAQKKKLDAEKEDFLSLKAEVEKIRAGNEEQLLKIREERDRLLVTEEERSEYVRLQSELKSEIEKCRQQEELLLKEVEDLKKQKENFEREWEELDGKRTILEKEQKNINALLENFEKKKLSEEERLRKEKQMVEVNIKEELDALEAAKESFRASMEHEKSVIAEKYQSERSQMIYDLELQRGKLESDIERRRDEMERDLQERKKSFEEERERELGNINSVREVARKEMEEMKQERAKMERDKKEVDASKRQFEGQQVEIRKDIDDLVQLSNRLKKQREQFIKDKNHFISLVEKHKSCKTCGETISEFVVADLQALQEMENPEVPVARVVDDYIRDHPVLNEGDGLPTVMSPTGGDSGSPISGGTMSWLRKCTSKIFMFSPGKKFESNAGQNLRDQLLGSDRANMERSFVRLGSGNNERELDSAIADGAHDATQIQSETSARGASVVPDLSVDEQSIINSTAGEDHVSSDLNHGRAARRRGRTRINRTRPAKALVQDMKAFQGEASDLNKNDKTSMNADDSGHANAEEPDESSLAGRGLSRKSQKRSHAETSEVLGSDHGGDDSEVRSESVVTGRKKRRQKVAPDLQTPGERRYNLRRPKIGVTVAKFPSDLNKEDDSIGGVGNGANQLKVPAAFAKAVTENGGVLQHGAAAANLNGDADTREKRTENMVLSEEVSVTPIETGDYADGDGGYRSETPEEVAVGLEDVEDEEEDDEYEPHPGEVSVGKKLWKFFTT